MAAETILSVTGLAKRYGVNEVVRDISFQLNDREHVALVGVNGAGKSTILRAIAGTEFPDEGEIARVTGLRVTYLPQEAVFESDRTVLEEARLAFAEALQAEERLREIESRFGSANPDEMDALLNEYGRLQHHFEHSGGYDMVHRTDAVLAGLGFTEDQLTQPVRQLSGGQKTRLALVKALLADPDLLLLDEPTNHLDLEMLDWLEEFLKGWSGACLVVSHDRYFLDRVTSRTLEVSFGRMEDYPAPYSRYLLLRKERRSRQLKEYEEQQEFIQRTEEFIRKYKAGQRAREAKGRQTRLDRLDRLEAPKDHNELKISIAPSYRSGKMVIQATPLSVGFMAEEGGELQMVKTPELTVERGDRVGLIGPNGSGKTTLLRTIVGEIEPRKGHVEFGTGATVGYYSQSHEQLPENGTPLSAVMSAQPMGEESARNFLGRFLFSNDDVFKPVSGLSGGERSRLALGLLLLQRANVLVLDEPTNHLDVLAREALEEMLDSFDGTIVFVSHDRYFADRIANRIWSIEDGELKQSLGNYSDWQRQKLRLQSPGKGEKQPEPEPPATESKLQNQHAPRPANPVKLQKELGALEKEIARLEGKLNGLSDDLTVASIDNNLKRIEKLGLEMEQIQSDLENAYARWEAASQEMAAVELTVAAG